MGDSTPLESAMEAFDNIDGISYNDDRNFDAVSHDVLVEVHDDNAVGHFFRIVRETGVKRSATERNSLLANALDSWIDNPE